VKIRWLAQARLEFRRAAENFDNASAANDFERLITATAGQLQTFPEAGRAGRVDGTREAVLVHFPYIIVYRIKEDEVQILNIQHTSRQWPPQTE